MALDVRQAANVEAFLMEEDCSYSHNSYKGGKKRRNPQTSKKKTLGKGLKGSATVDLCDILHLTSIVWLLIF